MIQDNNRRFITSYDPYDYEDLIYRIDDVCAWGRARNITADGGATALSQSKKMAEELQEFIDAETEDEAIDALGDMFVVLIQMHRLRGVPLATSLEAAWEQIKDRKGTMVDGVFVKEQ